jgi:putative glutathione S-transferase
MTKTAVPHFSGILGSDAFPIEAARYRLIWSEICPWSQRVAILRRLLGLEDIISEGKVNPVITEKGWQFSLDEGHRDPILDVDYVMAIYKQTDPNYPGRATIPVIVDVTTKKIVNNESQEIMQQLETNFTDFVKTDAPDLYPENLRTEIDALNAILLAEINQGVYKIKGAKTQADYEKYFHIFFNRLDQLEARLADSRFLFGDQMTDSDIRLYVSLARFDVAYYTTFRANRNRLTDFPNLWRYAKELYQMPAFRETTNFDAIKKGFALNNLEENPNQIVPLGPDTSIWDQ